MTFICYYGQVAHSMYFIQEGEVAITIGPGEKVSSTLISGMHFGNYNFIIFILSFSFYHMMIILNSFVLLSSLSFLAF